MGDLLVEKSSGDVALVLRKLEYSGHWLVLWNSTNVPTELDDVLVTSGYLEVISNESW